MTGGRTLETAFDKFHQHQTWLATAPEHEIAQWKQDQRIASLEKDRATASDRAKRAEAEAQQIRRETLKSSMKSELLQELSRVSFAGSLGDAVEEQALDDMLYTTATTDLKLYAKKYKAETGEDLKEIPVEVRRKAFDRVKALLSHRSKQTAEKAVEEASQKRSEEAAKKAAVASTKNYSKPADKELERQIRKRPTMLFKGRLK
jgi:hypothetical protein